ncbi:unknown [Ruminococcus sp. CAG:330]|nr:unknown [Ruminococcus sp. CAG:330]
MVKDVGEGDEQQRRTGIRLDTVGKACRNDNQTGDNGNGGVQNNDIDRFAQNPAILFQVAAKDLHGADADAQGKERLCHGSEQNRGKAVFKELSEVRHQIEFQTLHSTFQAQRIDRQNYHQSHEQKHHDLGYFFNTVLKAQRTDTNAKHNDQRSEQGHVPRRIQHLLEGICGCIGAGSINGAGDIAESVKQHPSGHHGVEHHEQIVSGDAHVLGEVVPAAGLFQLVQRLRNAAVAAAADGKFAHQNGQSQQNQTEEVEEQKSSSAILSADVRKFPDVSQSDGTAGGNQNKSES